MAIFQLNQSINQSINIYYMSNNTKVQRIAREALRSFNWPPKQTKELKCEYWKIANLQ